MDKITESITPDPPQEMIAVDPFLLDATKEQGARAPRRARLLSFLGFVVMALFCAFALPSVRATESETLPPNLVFILVDDLGYGDLGCYGNTVHRTPNIDQLAAEGALFTDYYVTSPVCTPARVALLTGRHPARDHTFGVLWPTSEGGLPTERITLAEWLGESGYVSGLAGKWHLGHLDPELLPPAQGFDTWYGMPYPNDMGPGHPMEANRGEEWPPMPMMRDGVIVEAPIDPNLLTQQYTAEAVGFIAENHDRPFFLFLSHAMPHTILGASTDFRGKSANGLYGDAVEELDWSVGEIMRVLRAFDLEERTLVVFTSDNGAAVGRPQKIEGDGWKSAGSNAPLRSGKGYVFEGGIRVPAIFRWPGVIEPGLVIETPAIITDTMVTFADLADLEPPPAAIDGASLASLLEGEAIVTEERPLFFGSGDVRAVRLGKWKFLLSGQPSWQAEIVEDPMLFDLDSDPGETNNLIGEYPKMAADLRAVLEAYQAEVDLE